MSTERVQGLADAYALFGNLPAAAREQLGVELAILGREALQAQQAAVPVGATGDLKAGLSLQLQIDQLRLRVGLLGLKKGRASLFYGVIIYTGRKAQTVLVQRRRRVNGKLRSSRGRKRTEDIAATYSLKVKPREAVPYIDVPGFDQLAAGQLAEFWSRTLARADGGPA